MKITHHNLCGLALVAGLATSSASAAVTIEWVTVGNAGNAAQSDANRTHSFAEGDGYGAVAYEYQIAKNETTIGQYAEFLNAVAKTDTYSLYSEGMTISDIFGISRSGDSGNYSYTVNPGSENKPITYTNWFDAARFCNWLHNGQPTTGTQTVGTTENGAYFLDGATSGVSVSKNPGATVWIPTENEWYKAAYYDPTHMSGAGGYWLHANQSDSMTSNSISDAGAANYRLVDGTYAIWISGGWGITDVGAYGADSASFYGTNDQGGNVWEWNDAVIDSADRGMRGGSWNLSAFGDADLRSSNRGQSTPTQEVYIIGFRVASVPEPSALVLTMLFSAALCTRRKR